MGDGSYGGNGSVYWKVAHKGSGGGPQKLKNLKAPGTNQKTDHWIDIKESTLSTFTITGDDIEGHDPKVLKPRDSFAVTARYETTSFTTSADLVKALADLIASASGALVKIAGGMPSAEVKFEVPIVNRNDPPTANEYELQVKW